jgi:hypothetical protein
MGRRIIVHIGLDKTGSSSLQHTLFRTEIPGVTYIRLGAANPSHPILLIFEPDFTKQAEQTKNVTGGTVTEERRALMAKHLNDRLGAVPADSVAVISAESIPTMSVEGMEALKNCLAGYFDQIDVIGYVRPPVSYVQSRFQHGVRTGRKKNFDVGFGYKDRLTSIDSVFGKDNVTLIKFDRSELLEGDIVKDFVKRAGSTISSKEIVTANESMSLEAMAVLFLCNIYGHKVTPKRHRLLLENELGDMGSHKLKFSAKFLAPVLENRRDDIEWVEKRLGVPFLDTTADGPDTLSDQDGLIQIALAQETEVLKRLAAHISKPNAADAHKASAVRILGFDDPVVRLVAAVELLADLLEKSLEPTQKES